MQLIIFTGTQMCNNNDLKYGQNNIFDILLLIDCEKCFRLYFVTLAKCYKHLK